MYSHIFVITENEHNGEEHCLEQKTKKIEKSYKFSCALTTTKQGRKQEADSSRLFTHVSIPAFFLQLLCHCLKSIM